MKALFFSLLLAVLGALLITRLTQPRALDAQLLQLQVAQTLPALSSDLSGESLEVQALFLDYAQDPVLLAKAHVALLRYPALARPVFLAYGDSPDFRDVLRVYGEDALLPIHYFMENDVQTLALMRGLGDASRAALDAVQRLWRGDASSGGFGDSGDGEDAVPAAETARLSGEDRGWAAIQFLKAEGYGFLGQFVVNAQGEVAWVQTERVLEGIGNLFAGGMRGLETRMRRDEPIGASDIGWAALDVAVGVSVLKVLRMGKGAVAGGRTLSLPQRTAVLGGGLWRGSAIGVRLAKYGAPAVLAYVAIRHPSVINAMLGEAADVLGLPVPVVQAAGWSLVLLPVIWLLLCFLRPLAWALSGGASMLRGTSRWLFVRARTSPAWGGRR